MGIIKNIRANIEASLEKKQELRDIHNKALHEERKKQTKRLATASVRIKASRKIKELRAPKPKVTGNITGFSVEELNKL